jgi:AcrR family transcriptional regulator
VRSRQAAGVNEATIFRHFATKSDLYAAIIDWKACVGRSYGDWSGHWRRRLETGDDRGLFEAVALTDAEINDAGSEHDAADALQRS